MPESGAASAPTDAPNSVWAQFSLRSRRPGTGAPTRAAAWNCARAQLPGGGADARVWRPLRQRRTQLRLGAVLPSLAKAGDGCADARGGVELRPGAVLRSARRC